ncbi:MAG: hypothetical protein ABJN04_06685 [Hyphomicrobiales bacterium]
MKILHYVFGISSIIASTAAASAADGFHIFELRIPKIGHVVSDDGFKSLDEFKNTLHLLTEPKNKNVVKDRFPTGRFLDKKTFEINLKVKSHSSKLQTLCDAVLQKLVLPSLNLRQTLGLQTLNINLLTLDRSVMKNCYYDAKNDVPKIIRDQIKSFKSHAASNTFATKQGEVIVSKLFDEIRPDIEAHVPTYLFVIKAQPKTLYDYVSYIKGVETTLFRETKKKLIKLQLAFWDTKTGNFSYVPRNLYIHTVGVHEHYIFSDFGYKTTKWSVLEKNGKKPERKANINTFFSLTFLDKKYQRLYRIPNKSKRNKYGFSDKAQKGILRTGDRIVEKFAGGLARFYGVKNISLTLLLTAPKGFASNYGMRTELLDNRWKKLKHSGSLVLGSTNKR